MNVTAITGTIVVVLTVFASVIAFAVDNKIPAATGGYQIAVDQNGAIRLPDLDYRKDWVSLGSWAVAAEEGIQGSEGIHVVYTQPKAVAAYRKTGEFPDGAVLIKELFSATTREMATGTVSRAEETTGWFVMIKDSTGRFPDNTLWGDGWGWAFFNASEPNKTTTSDYKAECKGCHIPARRTDWIYTMGYPVLKN